MPGSEAFKMLVIAQHLEQQSNVNVKDPRGTETNNIEKTNTNFEQEPLKGQVHRGGRLTSLDAS